MRRFGGRGKKRDLSRFLLGRMRMEWNQREGREKPWDGKARRKS
jgi:hypothetical protein